MILVVKLGGGILEEGLPEGFVEDFKLALREHRAVLVHGGGRLVDEVAEKMGKKQRFVVSPGGFRSRYTDKETMEIFAMVMAGKVNKGMVSALAKAGVKAIGLSGVDGGLIKAERKKRIIEVDERGRKRAIDGGYTGRIVEVDGRLLLSLLDMGYTPVVAPIALSEEYEALNVDGDRAAAHIAAALKADLLILLTDVPGLMVDGRLVPKLRLSEVEGALAKAGPGMVTKLYAAAEALRGGAKKAVIASGIRENPVSSALRGVGTVVEK